MYIGVSDVQAYECASRLPGRDLYRRSREDGEDKRCHRNDKEWCK